MSTFEIKGWCPGALRPMMSGDGLVVRVRPHAGRLSAAQARGVAQAARAHGSGLIDLSSRANLQLRGVRSDRHSALVADLDALGLLDPDSVAESRRNIVVTPFWSEGGDERMLAEELERALASSDLILPGKFGFAIDCGRERVLDQVPSDIRIERGAGECLIVRPDGATCGLAVKAVEAPATALALAKWFVESGGISDGRGRMAAHIRKGATLPRALSGGTLPVAPARQPEPGYTAGGALVAVAFGSMHADTLEELARHALELRMTPWRMIFLPSAHEIPAGLDLVTQADDPILRVEACTGAPWCPQACAETRPLARRLAAHVPEGSTLHVSGCAKGCACMRRALTLVATGNGFDLIREGTASDGPAITGLSASQIVSNPARYLGGL
jgi:precorrin-3B synthase